MDVARCLAAQGSWLLGGVIMARAVGQLPTESLFEIGLAFRVSSCPSHVRTLAPRSTTPMATAYRPQHAKVSARRRVVESMGAWRKHRSTSQPEKGCRRVHPQGAPIKYEEDDVARDPSSLNHAWKAWMLQNYDCWRVATIKLVKNDLGAAGGVKYLQTNDTPMPNRDPGNIVRLPSGSDEQFNLYLRQGGLEMEELEAAIGSHPFVKSSTVEICNGAMLGSSSAWHEGPLHLKFNTWDNDQIIAGLTRYNEGKDACGGQVTHAWIRLSTTKVPRAHHSRLCDMLLNACGYFSWFECGQIERVMPQPGAPFPPSSATARSKDRQPATTTLTVKERIEKLKLAGAGLRSWSQAAGEIGRIATRACVSTVFAAAKSVTPTLRSQIEGESAQHEIARVAALRQVGNAPALQKPPPKSVEDAELQMTIAEQKSFHISESPAGPSPEPPVRARPAPPMAAQEGMLQPVAPLGLDPQLPTTQEDGKSQPVAPPGALDPQLQTKQEEKVVEFCSSWPLHLLLPAHASKLGAPHRCETIDGEVHLQQANPLPSQSLTGWLLLRRVQQQVLLPSEPSQGRLWQLVAPPGLQLQGIQGDEDVVDLYPEGLSLYPLHPDHGRHDWLRA
jgi:hypothetical protein